MQGAAFALQIGVDALVLRPDNDHLWSSAITAREQRSDAAKEAAAAAAAARTTPDGGSSSSDDDDVRGGEKNAASQKNKKIGVAELSVGRVTGAREGGVGDRVCVDLIQSLVAGEGMLVGSSAKMLALVHAETFETGFVPARQVVARLEELPSPRPPSCSTMRLLYGE